MFKQIGEFRKPHQCVMCPCRMSLARMSKNDNTSQQEPSACCETQRDSAESSGLSGTQWFLLDYHCS